MDAMHDTPSALPVARPADLAMDATAARRLDSIELLGGHREVLIAHGDQTYRLRLTASNKLILVK
jgi:hemin uptake protein HemP